MHIVSKRLWRISLLPRAAVNICLSAVQTTPVKWDSWSQSISMVILLWYQSQNGNIFYSGRLSVQQIHRNVGSELQLNPTAFMSGASASISFRPATPPVSLCFFFLKSNMHTAREPENLLFTLSALPQTKCWKWHVMSKVRLITEVRQAGRT